MWAYIDSFIYWHRVVVIADISTNASTTITTIPSMIANA